MKGQTHPTPTPKVHSLRERLSAGISSLASSFRSKFHTALAIAGATLAISSSAGAQTRPTAQPDSSNYLGDAEAVVVRENDTFKRAREHASVERGILNVMRRANGLTVVARREAAANAYLLNQLVIADRAPHVHTYVDYDTTTGMIRSANSDQVQVHRLNDVNGTDHWYAISVTPGSGGNPTWTSEWHLLSEANHLHNSVSRARRTQFRRAVAAAATPIQTPIAARQANCPSTPAPAQASRIAVTQEPLPEYLQPTCAQIATIARDLNTALSNYGIQVSCGEIQRGNNVHTALEVRYHGATARIPVAIQRREYPNNGTSFLLTTAPTTPSEIQAMDMNVVLASFRQPLTYRDLSRATEVSFGNRMLLPGITPSAAVSSIGRTSNFYGFGAINALGINLPSRPDIPARINLPSALRTLLQSVVTTAPVRPVQILSAEGDILAQNHAVIGSHGQVNFAFSPDQINEIITAATRVLQEQTANVGNAVIATHVRTRLTPPATQTPANARQKPSDEVRYVDPTSAEYRTLIGTEDTDNEMVTPGAIAGMFRAMRTTATPSVVVDSIAYSPTVRNVSNGSGAHTEFANTADYLAGLDRHYESTRRAQAANKDHSHGATMEAYASPQEAAFMLARLEEQRTTTFRDKARAAMRKVFGLFNRQVA